MSKKSKKVNSIRRADRNKDESPGRKPHRFLIALLVAAAALAAFGSSVRGVFVWDDEYVVRQNLFIRDAGNLRHLATGEYFEPAGRGHYTRSGEESYRPVVTLSHFLDYALFGLNPAGYHAMNVLLHMLACVGLYFLFVSLGTGRAGAAIGAALFAVHPVNSEAVNMISYREDLLAGMFIVLAFNAWEKRRAAPSVIFFALALLSKEMALAFLPLVASREIISGAAKIKSGNAARRIDSFLPEPAVTRLFMLLLAVAILYLCILFFAFPSAPPRQAVHPGGSILTGAATMARVLGHYMHLAVFPAHLRVDYAFTASTGLIELPAVLSLSAAILIIFAAFRLPLPGSTRFMITWFFLALIPVSGLYPITNYIAERYLYIPLMGWCGAAGAGLAALFSNRNRGLRIAGIVLAGTLLTSGIVLNNSRNPTWRSGERFYREMVRSSPDSYRGFSGLGVALYRRKQLVEADCALTRSIELKPDHAIAIHNLGNVKQGLGDQDAAFDKFRSVIELDPSFVESRYQLALILKSRGELEAAEQELLRTLSINHNFIPARFILGVIHQERADYEIAAEIYRSILTIEPSYAKALKNLGILHLYRFDDRETASYYLKRYLALVPGDPQREQILAAIGPGG